MQKFLKQSVLIERNKLVNQIKIFRLLKIIGDIRPITCELGILPNAHGSALFTRGETQALVSLTLGTKEDAQIVDNGISNEQKRFYLH